MSLWAGVAGGLAAAFVNQWVTRHALRGKARRDQAGGAGARWRHIDYGIGYKSIACIAAAVALVLTIAASGAREDQRTAALLVGLAFSGGGIWLLYEIFLRRVRFDAREIQSLHVMGIVRTIRFADVADARYLRSIGMARIRSVDGRQIWVPLAGGYKLLSRLGRWLERKHVLDTLLKRAHLAAASSGADEGDATRALLDSVQLISPRTTTVDLKAVHGWASTGSPHGRCQVAMVERGEAVLFCRQHRWPMQVGDRISVPAGFPFRVVILPADTEQATALTVVTGLSPAR